MDIGETGRFLVALVLFSFGAGALAGALTARITERETRAEEYRRRDHQRRADRRAFAHKWRQRHP